MIRLILSQLQPIFFMQLDAFDFDFDGNLYESHSQENGFVYWYASDLARLLGYSNPKSFEKSIQKAVATLTTLNINIFENIQQIQKEDDEGRFLQDYKLSRFACYLAVMNADSKMLMVAKAQAYFATLAGAIQNYISEAEKVERLTVRDEVSEREKSLSAVAKSANLESFPLFQNMGYRGMYNKNIKDLKRIRNVSNDRSLLDFMGKDELAANLFRITQTELKIKNEKVSGQSNLEKAALSVGKKVRQTMIEISNIKPEDLPVHDDIKRVKSGLKSTNKLLKKLDDPKKKKKK